MCSVDEPRAWATMPIPGPGNSDEENAVFDTAPIERLAEIWCGLQSLGIREQTPQSWTATLYFDRLPHAAPERALDLALAVLRTDVDKLTKMQLGEKFMSTLIYNHAGRVVDRLEAEAPSNRALRWLLGAVHWWAPSRELKARLARLADEKAWRADEAARDRPAINIDYAALSMPDLARFWVDQHAKPEKDRDSNWHALMDYERDLVRHDPGVVIDLVIEILRIETSPEMLSLLAAGLVEDVIAEETIERIEREAAANERFRVLLGGVWYANKGAALKARLDAIVKERPW
ncbi:MAG: hypothetical protein R3D62_09025 [Xanthobacteraceae bacterium]